MIQALVDRLIEAVLEREGGYVACPADPGGETNWGVTLNTARAHGYEGAMRDLPRDVARRIYLLTYWTKPRLDLVAQYAPLTAAELFDTGVNMGTAAAARFLQRALNAMNRQQADWADVAADGVIGSATLAALAAHMTRRGRAGDAVLARALDCLQGARIIEIAETRPASEAFVYGWLAGRTGGQGEIVHAAA